MKAPFPYFGGKSKIAQLVWQQLGKVKNYTEPFFGSGAVLLAREPDEDGGYGIETVNDLDCYIANFWRALQAAPGEVAKWADWPVNEVDLHARHHWLVEQTGAWRERMMHDPECYDAKIAGWWVWGISQWIGSGWCAGGSSWNKRPHLGNPGMGVHARGIANQLPQLRNAGEGVHAKSHVTALYELFNALATRLRRVRVCCGNWDRILGPSPTVKHGLTGVFLDPPYSDEKRADGLYGADSFSVAHDVREWCLAHGDDPLLRIALCGYEGEHEMPPSWECMPWKANGGYGSLGNGAGRENCHRERVWFSPHCLRPGDEGSNHRGVQQPVLLMQEA